MSIRCTASHVSYTRWRLQTFPALVTQPRTHPSLILDSLRCNTPRWSASRALRATRNFASSPDQRLFGFRAKPRTINSKDQNVTSYAQQESSVDNSVNGPQHAEAVSVTDRTKRWTPYGEKGQSDLAVLLKHLDRVGEGLEQTDKVDLLDKASDQVLESPLLRRMRQKQQRPHKRRNTHSDDERLQNNPWAQLLASPPRICNATNTRLPRQLIVPWTMLKGTKNEHIYLMPAQLADLDAFRDSLQAANRGSVSKRVTQGYQLKAGILPFQPLLQHLTSIFIKEDRPGKFQTSTRQMNRLLSVFATKAFAAAQKQMQRSGVSRQNPEAAASSNYELDWQQDIDQRVRTIMQQRVLIALESLVTLHGKRFTNVASGLELPHLGRRRTNPNTMDTSDRSDLGLTVDDDEDIIFRDLPGSIILHIGKSRLGSAEKLDRIFHNKRHIAPSLLALRNPENTSLAWEYDGSPNEQPLPPLPTHSLIPHMVTISNRIRVPVFSLQYLLGPHFDPNYDAITKAVHHLTGPEQHLTDESRHAQEAGHNHTSKAPIPRNLASMTLIRGTNPATRILIEEIWQLWRYVGGYKRDGMSVHTGDMLDVDTRLTGLPKSRSTWWQTGVSAEEKLGREDSKEGK